MLKKLCTGSSQPAACECGLKADRVKSRVKYARSISIALQMSRSTIINRISAFDLVADLHDITDPHTAIGYNSAAYTTAPVRC